jgi:microcystin-dependent protein
MKVASRGFGDAVRGLSHHKGAKVSIGRGTPTKKEGSDGDLTLRNTNMGVILYAKYGGRWYTLKTNQVLTPGMIIMWSGRKQDIPKGWQFCDGNMGTPDLRAKFIIGAGPGALLPGGSTNGSYESTKFGPDSSESYGESQDSYGKADISEVTGNIEATATASHTLTTSQIPEHNHNYTYNSTNVTRHGGVGSSYQNTEVSESHESSNIGGGGSHSHDISEKALSDGTTTTTNTGKPLVDWYSLAFIMYVGGYTEPGTEGSGTDDGSGSSLGREG